MRAELMKALSARAAFRRSRVAGPARNGPAFEEFARRLMDQQIDPRQAGIDWNAFRDSQRDVAREAIAAALVLDEITRREQLDPTEEEVEQEIGRYAERTGRTAAAVRAGLEKEGGLSRVRAGLRREKAIEFANRQASVAE